VSAPEADLDVVIVNYNAGEYLARCIQSLFAHGGDATVRVVVVDNASRDGSADGVPTRTDVRLIRNSTNRGFSAAINQGIGESSAPFILLLNPDAEIVSGTLGGLLKLTADRARVGAVGPMIRNPDGTVYPTGRKFPTIIEAVGHALLGPFRPENRFTRSYTLAEWDRTTERRVDWVSMSCMLVRRRAIEEVGLLDESFFLNAEELDLCTRLRDGGWWVLFTPEVEVVHEGGVSTGRSKRMTLEHSRSVYRYFAKHRANGWRRLLLPLAWSVLRVRAEIVSMRRNGR
jgi:N-acetylglucosaminyl-diphospho-decaprenol L-rhamnosyltransferase